jgi:antitoxin ChpS
MLTGLTGDVQNGGRRAPFSSVVMAVPKKILGLVHLDAGSKVELSVENGRLLVDPSPKPRYKLAELLSRCGPGDLAPRRESKRWLRGGPAGRELI